MEPEGAASSPDLRFQSGPHVFVVDLDSLELADDDRHHLSRSLRLRAGDALTASDAQGRWRPARFGQQLEPDGPIHRVPDPPYPLGLGIALTKAAKPEFAVQKATELGMDTICVFQATFSVARWDETKRSKQQQRLTRVAREAAMQSRRVTLPTIEVVPGLEEAIKNRTAARADFGGIATNSEQRFVLIGPEGGWSPDEVASVPAAVDLGPTVLRAETAAVVAAAFLARSRGAHR